MATGKLSPRRTRRGGLVAKKLARQKVVRLGDIKKSMVKAQKMRVARTTMTIRVGESRTRSEIWRCLVKAMMVFMLN